MFSLYQIHTFTQTPSIIYSSTRDSAGSYGGKVLYTMWCNHWNRYVTSYVSNDIRNKTLCLLPLLVGLGLASRSFKSETEQDLTG